MENTGVFKVNCSFLSACVASSGRWELWVAVKTANTEDYRTKGWWNNKIAVAGHGSFLFLVFLTPLHKEVVGIFVVNLLTNTHSKQPITVSLAFLYEALKLAFLVKCFILAFWRDTWSKQNIYNKPFKACSHLFLPSKVISQKRSKDSFFQASSVGGQKQIKYLQSPKEVPCCMLYDLLYPLQ